MSNKNKPYIKKGYNPSSYSEEKQQKMQEGRLREQRKKMDLFLEMYTKCDCNLTETCKVLNLSIGAVRGWKVHYPEFKQACDDAYITVVNKAEKQLQKLIDKGHPAAIMFFLKCKGGYKENASIELNANVTSKQLILNLDPFSNMQQQNTQPNQTIILNDDSTNNGIE